MTKNDIIEIVEPIRTYKKSEKAFESFFKNAKQEIIYIGMKFQPIDNIKVEMAMRLSDVSCLDKKFILHDNESKRRVEFLINFGNVVKLAPEKMDFSHLPSGFEPYWPEIIASPNELVYLHPHNPNSNRNYHRHEGFKIHGDDGRKGVVTTLCHSMLTGFIQNIRDKDLPYRIPPLEKIVDNEYLDANRNNLKKQHKDKWVIISGGRVLKVANNYRDMFEYSNRKTNEYADKLCVDLKKS